MSPSYLDTHFNTMNHLIDSLGRAIKSELDKNGCTDKYLMLMQRMHRYSFEREL